MSLNKTKMNIEFLKLRATPNEQDIDRLIEECFKQSERTNLEHLLNLFKLWKNTIDMRKLYLSNARESAKSVSSNTLKKSSKYTVQTTRSSKNRTKQETLQKQSGYQK